MKKILIAIAFVLLITKSQSQTIDIDLAEKCFSLNKSKLIDTLKTEGFNNLSDDEIYEEELLESKSNTPPNPKQRIYTTGGIRKVYELRQRIGGGICKISLVMKEPKCNYLSSIFWNANLQWSASAYFSQLERLGYKKTDEQTIEKYENLEKGFKIIVRIRKYRNEISFTMSKL